MSSPKPEQLDVFEQVTEELVSDEVRFTAEILHELYLARQDEEAPDAAIVMLHPVEVTEKLSLIEVVPDQVGEASTTKQPATPSHGTEVSPAPRAPVASKEEQRVRNNDKKKRLLDLTFEEAVPSHIVTLLSSATVTTLMNVLKSGMDTHGSPDYEYRFLLASDLAAFIRTGTFEAAAAARMEEPDPDIFESRLTQGLRAFIADAGNAIIMDFCTAKIDTGTLGWAELRGWISKNQHETAVLEIDDTGSIAAPELVTNIEPSAKPRTVEALFAFARQDADHLYKYDTGELVAAKRLFRRIYEGVIQDGRALGDITFFEQILALRIFEEGENPEEFVILETVRSEIKGLGIGINDAMLSLIKHTLEAHCKYIRNLDIGISIDSVPSKASS